MTKHTRISKSAFSNASQAKSNYTSSNPSYSISEASTLSDIVSINVMIQSKLPDILVARDVNAIMGFINELIFEIHAGSFTDPIIKEVVIQIVAILNLSLSAWAKESQEFKPIVVYGRIMAIIKEI